MQQFLRKIRVTFAGQDTGVVINQGAINEHDMRVSFEVQKSITGKQNYARIELYNLSENLRNSVGKELDNVFLEAGYYPNDTQNNVGIIFAGQMRDVVHTKQGNDIITTLSCGDGDAAMRKSVLSKTYPAGSRVVDVMNDIYTEFEKYGVQKGEWKFPDDVPTFKRPYSVFGSCSREANLLGRGKKFYWSIQNQTMEVIPSDGFLPGTVFLNSSTGLVGTPEITDNGARITCLLNPEIRPNRQVAVESDILSMNAQDGVFRVSEITYNGDNYDGDFTCTIDGESIKEGKVDEGKK